jgi:hypothetical protein
MADPQCRVGLVSTLDPPYIGGAVYCVNPPKGAQKNNFPIWDGAPVFTPKGLDNSAGGRVLAHPR